MPYIKPHEPQFGKMRRLLIGYGCNATRLAAILGTSVPTARKRLDNPGMLSLSDLDRINRKGHIPMEEIKSAMCR